MTAKILSGQEISQKIRNNIASEIKQRNNANIRTPRLAVILVGEDPASQIYVKNKQLAAKEAGMVSKTYNLPATTNQQELLTLINKLNTDPNIDGILVQLPLPKHINTQAILEQINPNKDVDGFHPINIGKLLQGHPTFHPCTPYGIMLLIKETKVALRGLNATVVGASNIVGKPMAFELLHAEATVTICHKWTKDLPSHVNSADLLIVATGNPQLIKGSWLKSGAIVIDVGMNRLPNGTIVGDVAFATAKERASWITPVPGGVGPMTIAMLLQNTLLANKMAISKSPDALLRIDPL